ncbi:MAG: GNAT family N-acetyltransferase [Lachnospiraceae bacterium]|nr:GNAT family N-acetyltransferase [Lachnospiraceae bacterium]
MNIRRAHSLDMEGINRLLLQVCLVHHRGRPDLFKYGGKKYTDEELQAILSDDSRPVFVAVEDAAEGAGTSSPHSGQKEQVLGYAFCISQQHLNNNILTDIKTLYIDDLCVLEDMRGQGIGRQLCEHVKTYARKNGYYNITLNVWSLNEAALGFYEVCGFLPQKIGMELLLLGESL